MVSECVCQASSTIFFSPDFRRISTYGVFSFLFCLVLHSFSCIHPYIPSFLAHFEMSIRRLQLYRGSIRVTNYLRNISDVTIPKKSTRSWMQATRKTNNLSFSISNMYERMCMSMSRKGRHTHRKIHFHTHNMCLYYSQFWTRFSIRCVCTCVVISPM